VWEQAVVAAMECDVLLVVGTSAVVYPAASLIPLARGKDRPAAVIEFNLTPTEASTLADIGVYGPSGQTLPRVMERLA
jgi:NAD-dependent deacetylase